VRTDLGTRLRTEIRPGRAWTGARSEPWANSNRFVDLSVVNQSQEYFRILIK